MILALSANYGYVFLAAAFISFECLLIGFIFPGLARRKYFTQDFMRQFEEVHRREVDPGSTPSKEGFPDMGNGMYAQRLSYGQWVGFNNAQRVHYNFLQSISTVITLLMIGGIYYPVIAASFGLGIFIARIIYSLGYYLSGASGRLVGVLIIDVCLLGLFVLSIITGVKFVQGIPPVYR